MTKVTKNILIISSTNTITQRTILITNTLAKENNTIYLCWQRFAVTNIDNNKTILINENRFVKYLYAVAKYLLYYKYNTVIFSDYRLFPVILSLAKLKKANIVYNNEEIPTVTGAEKIVENLKLNFRLAYKLMYKIEHFFSKSVDGILSVPLEADLQRQFMKYNANTEIILNVPDISIKSKAYRITELSGKEYLIYSGVIFQEKGLHHYLNLIKKLRAEQMDIYLLLIGHLWNIRETELTQIIDDVNHECGGVVYKRWIPYENLLTIISNATIGLALLDPNFVKFKYLWNGATRKMFTYMSCGIPVITNKPFGSVVTEENCGIRVDYDDETTLFKETASLLRAEQKRKLMGINGKNAIINKYSWKLEENKVLKVFENIWKETGRSTS